MDKEEFRWIKGYEGIYKISNLGRVYSVPRVDSLMRNKGGCFVSTQKNRGGYVVISLNKDGKQHSHILHRLVAQTFIPNPCNKPEVDHIDANKDNNTAVNLRWCTRKENINNPITHALMSGNAKKNPVCGNKNPFSRRVAQYSLSGEFISEFESTGIASKNTNVSIHSIQRCAKGKRKTGGGYIWKYLSEPKIQSKGRIPIGYNGKHICQIDSNGNLVAEYVSISQAAAKTGFFAPNISYAVRGKSKTYKGYIWK